MMIKKISHFFKLHLRFLLVVLLVINIGIIITFSWRLIETSKDTAELATSAQAKEIVGIKSTANSTLQATLYRQLIERVGPTQAQEDLYHSGLPFDGQTHLINHSVGDWLYGKYGTKGLAYCKDYFLSSCYHGFLIRFIADKGIDDMGEVMKGCWQIGRATASQCAHGIGHGLLAWDGYKNLPEALADCDKVADLSSNFPIYNCYDGVFMENNWAVHNGEPSPDRWVKESDPTYPCYDERIAEKYRKGCWSNQPQVMYKIFGGDVTKVAKECENIKAKEYIDTCFDSLARQINPVAQGDIKKVFDLCNKMPVGWKNPCVNSNVGAFFSVGDRELSFVLCQMIPESGVKGCYETLQQKINSYTTNLEERTDLCKKVPALFRSEAYCPST